jgi:hypothetical protein
MAPGQAHHLRVLAFQHPEDFLKIAPDALKNMDTLPNSTGGTGVGRGNYIVSSLIESARLADRKVSPPSFKQVTVLADSPEQALKRGVEMIKQNEPHLRDRRLKFTTPSASKLVSDTVLAPTPGRHFATMSLPRRRP